MCAPQLVFAGLALAASTASAVGQYQQAKASNKAAEKQAQVQADEFASSRDQAISERIKAARIERGRLQVAAGESGVGGASLNAQFRDSFGRQNQDLAVIQKQSGFTERGIATDLKGVAARNHFSPVSAGLQIASNTAGAYYGAKTKD